MRFHDHEAIARAASLIAAAAGGRIACATILGSGFAPLVELLDGTRTIPFSEIPGLSACGAPGHAGEIVIGTIGGVRHLFFSGRLHLYDGREAAEVAAPVGLARALGADRILLTSAAGATTEDFQPGDLVLVDDHLNLTGTSPLLAIPTAARRPPFLPMSDAYDRNAAFLAERLALEHGAPIRRGVLAGLPGPSFETPAEYRALAGLGADLVTMSCVLETIAARSLGLRVLGLAVVANGPARLGEPGAEGDEVLRVVATAVRRRIGFFQALLEAFARL